jgi:hypothetical protein
VRVPLEFHTHSFAIKWYASNLAAICFLLHKMLLSKSLRVFYDYYFQVCFDDDRSENLNSSFTRLVSLNIFLIVCSSEVYDTAFTHGSYVY